MRDFRRFGWFARMEPPKRHEGSTVANIFKGGNTYAAFGGLGRDSDWVRNIEAKHGADVTVGLYDFAASHRFLGEEEAAKVIRNYEHRNRFIAPIVRGGFSWLLG